MKSFRASANAVRASGVDVRRSLERLQRALKDSDVAALQKAHRDYLLKLHQLGGGRRPEEQRAAYVRFLTARLATRDWLPKVAA